MSSLNDAAYKPSLADELSQMGDRITQLQNGLDGVRFALHPERAHFFG